MMSAYFIPFSDSYLSFLKAAASLCVFCVYLRDGVWKIGVELESAGARYKPNQKN